MIKQKEKKNWTPMYTLIISFLTALSHKDTFDFFNLKKDFIEYFYYSFVSCPCDNFLTKE